ncbi:hypothetical protein ACNUCX_08205 [Curtobacterium flaccumfaciens pv. flaccumfaciens]|uniref:hypothetical protein n=1 Tax=Curtobacterium flaccumfaciens TaxID=2035 RepID=UPI003AB32D3B
MGTEQRDWRDQGTGPTTGRGNAIAIALVLPVLLVVSWAVQVGAYLARDFGSMDDRLGAGGVLTRLVIAAVLAVGIPVAVLVVQVRARRREPRHSLVAVVAAIVVLVIAVPWNGLVLTSQLRSMAADARQWAQPATAAERHFADGDARATLERIGDRTVRILGGDRKSAYRDGERAGGAYSEDCQLSNAHQGVRWMYWYDPGEYTDEQGNELLPEDHTVIEGANRDVDGVREYWASEGIDARSEEDMVPDQIAPTADWLGNGSSYTRPGPDVDFRTICLVR